MTDTQVHKCPVCNGSGEVNTLDNNYSGSNLVRNTKTCHGCDGKGWVVVYLNYSTIVSDCTIIEPVSKYEN